MWHLKLPILESRAKITVTLPVGQLFHLTEMLKLEADTERLISFCLGPPGYRNPRHVLPVHNFPHLFGLFLREDSHENSISRQIVFPFEEKENTEFRETTDPTT